MPVRALPAGVIGTLFSGPLPTDARQFCSEGKTCPVTGVKEVWYGANDRWVFKLGSGNIVCSYLTFTDPIYGTFKNCHERDGTVSTILPPLLSELQTVFELNDLISTQNRRYQFSVMLGATETLVTTNKFERNLIALPLPPDPGITQTSFQFNINDTGTPGRLYSVFISPTQERCPIFHVVSAMNTEISIGRYLEIFTLMTQPDADAVPQRSDMQKVCTNDKGQVTFHLKPPSIDAFQIKVVTHGRLGKPNDVFDLFVPTSLDWMLHK